MIVNTDQRSFTSYYGVFTQSPSGSTKTNAPTTVKWTNTKTGTSVRGWKRLIKKGGNASSAYTFVQRRREYSPTFASIGIRKTSPPLEVGYYATTLSGDVGLTTAIISGPTPTASQTADNIAIHKLYAKLRKGYSPNNIAEDIGEIRKTISGILSPAKAIRDLTVGAMRKNIGLLSRYDRRGVIKDLASTHLEWQFGIKPLVQSVTSVYKEFGLKGIELVREFDVKHFKATGKYRDPGTVEYLDGLVGVGHVKLSRSRIRTTVSEVRYVGAYQLSVSDTHYRNLGITPDNFLPTLYNCLPWSWAIDYVTNVSDFVNNISCPNLRYIYFDRCEYASVVDRQQICGMDYLGTFPTNATMAKSVFNPGYLRRYYTKKSRTPVTSPPVPRLQVLPQLSGVHGINLAAAIFQLIDPLQTKAREYSYRNNFPFLRAIV